ncbi:MAG: S1 RNA-binding domain-containing protein, partial [Gemmatimonadales bacterium]
ENKRISLGIKQTQDDPWPAISERLTPGVEVDGSVVRVQDKGVVVDLGDDIEGFVPASHSSVEDANRLEEYYGAGQPVPLRVIESDAANRRIVLEVTEEPKRRPQEELDAEKAPKAEDAEAEGDLEVEAASEDVDDDAAEAESEEDSDADDEESDEAEADEADADEADAEDASAAPESEEETDGEEDEPDDEEDGPDGEEAEPDDEEAEPDDEEDGPDGEEDEPDDEKDD